MCLEQMASRCPDSILTAIGTLRGYRWQINQRGVANVVPSSPSDIVVGIVFRVYERDVKTLDRHEGISKGFYEKESLDIELHPLLLDELSEQQTAVAVRRLRDYEKSPREAQAAIPRSVETAIDYTQQRTPLKYIPATDISRIQDSRMVRALVYLSRQYCNDGSIRAEYVSRMTLAVSDGKTLGISSSYLEHDLLPIILSKPQDPIQPKKISKRKQVPRSDTNDPPSVSDEGSDVHGQQTKHRHSVNHRKRRHSVVGEEPNRARSKKSQESSQRDASQQTWLQWIWNGGKSLF
jgi:hypothetical protein